MWTSSDTTILSHHYVPCHFFLRSCPVSRFKHFPLSVKGDWECAREGVELGSNALTGALRARQSDGRGSFSEEFQKTKTVSNNFSSVKSSVSAIYTSSPRAFCTPRFHCSNGLPLFRELMNRANARVAIVAAKHLFAVAGRGRAIPGRANSGSTKAKIQLVRRSKRFGAPLKAFRLARAVAWLL